MEYRRFIIPVLAVLVSFGAIAHAAFPPSTTRQGGTGTTTPSGILYGDNGSTLQLHTVSIGSNLTFSGGTLSASASGSGTVGTSTIPTIGQLAYWTSKGFPSLLGSVATGTVSAGTGISVTANRAVIGGSLSITNTSPLSGLSTSFPFAFSNPTLSWIGLATSTNLTAGDVLYATGVKTVGQVATSTNGTASTIAFIDSKQHLTIPYASTTQAGSTGSDWFATSGGSVHINTTKSVADLLNVGDSLSSLPAGLNQAIGEFSANTNTIDGVDFSNTNTSGTGTDFRFIISDPSGHYLAISEPGEGNNGTLFGQARSGIDTIFNNGGTARDLVIGTVTANKLIFGTNNTARANINSSGLFTLGNASSTLLTASTQIWTPKITSISGNLIVGATSGNATLSCSGTNCYTFIASNTQTIQFQNAAFEPFYSGTVSLGGSSDLWSSLYTQVLTDTGAKLGISSSTPTYSFSVGTGAKAFYIATSTGEVVGYDTIYSHTGQLNPLRPFSLQVSTTTTWTGTSTQTSLYGDLSAVPAPWTGPVTKLRCFTNVGTMTGELTSGSNHAYFVSSSTPGLVTLSSPLSITAGDKIYLQGGNPASSAQRMGCTFMSYITP